MWTQNETTTAIPVGCVKVVLEEVGSAEEHALGWFPMQDLENVTRLLGYHTVGTTDGEDSYGKEHITAGFALRNGQVVFLVTLGA